MLYIVYHILYIIYYLLYIIYYILFIIYHILFIIYPVGWFKSSANLELDGLWPFRISTCC